MKSNQSFSILIWANKSKSDAPNEYFAIVKEQCSGGALRFGGITDIDSLKLNLKENDIPENIMDLTIDNFPEFLVERRKLISMKLKSYYLSL